MGALAIDPADPLTVYAGTGDLNVVLSKTTDGGATWVASDEGLPPNGVLSLAVDPSDSETVYAGVLLGGVYKSIDAGASWASSSNGMDSNLSVFTFAFDPSNPKILYVGAEGPEEIAGVYKSIDAGATWVRMSEGIGSPLDTSVYALAIDPTSPTTIYAATACPHEDCSETEVYKSTDGAATWTSVLEVDWANPRFSSLAIDPSDPSTVWAGHDHELGAYMTTDGGGTWAAANDGLTNPFVFALVFRPAPPHTLYAGTSGGVFAFVKDQSGSSR